jgi:hypothetical protein
MELKQNLSIEGVAGIFWVISPDDNLAFPFATYDTAIRGMDRLATEFDIYRGIYISRPINQEEAS